MKLMSELKRRNVLRMAAIYVVAAWLILQFAEVLAGLTNIPDWLGPTLLVTLAIGFPIALLISWFYDLTPEGITADVGTLQRLPKIAPGGVVRELAYTGRRLPAARAKEIGSVNEVYPSREEMIEGVTEIAREVAARSPLSLPPAFPSSAPAKFPPRT